MEWLNEPTRWSEGAGKLTVVAEAGTDFWRTTNYGYVRDDGHLYGERVQGEFSLRMLVQGSYSSQYDQAGAMIRVDEGNWIKTGVEYFDGRMRLSTVATYDRSSWFVAELPPGAEAGLRLSLSRRGDALEIRYRVGEAPEDLAAICFLRPDVPVLAGAMCAAPDGGGFEVAFSEFAVDPVGG